MFKKTLVLMGGVVAVLGAAMNPANAATIFTSKVDWQKATSPGVITLDFENYPGNGSYVGDFSNNGVFFDAKATYGPDQYIFSWSSSSGYDQGTGKWMLGGFSVPGSYRRYLEVSVPNIYNSFGLDVGTYAQSGYVSVLATTNLGTFEKIVATPSRGVSFVGFTLGNGENLLNLKVENVASLTGGVGNKNFTFDNFVLGTAASVPEPSTILGAVITVAFTFGTSFKSKLVGLGQKISIK